MRSILLLTICCGGVAFAADPFPIDSATLRKLSRSAPYRAEFPGGMTFRLPESLRFVTEDKLAEFIDRMKLAQAGDEVGVVVPEDMSWYTMIFLPKDDPLEGQTDHENLNRDALMAWQEKFTSNHTARKSGLNKTYRLGSWTHPPRWDKDKKTLEMGVRMASDSGDTSHDLMNYKIIAYGPEKQIVCFQTIAPLTDGKFEKPVQRTPKLVEELMFPAVIVEASETEAMMYYAQLIGGGLIGTLLVIVLAKLFTGNRRPMPGTRRPGLPR